VGDSIGYNLPADCPGCTGFVHRYAEALGEAAGEPVKEFNLTEHNGLQVDMLLSELEASETMRAALSDANAIVVAIAHNDNPLNRDDDPCDGPGGESPDWSKFTDACLAEVAETFRPKYEELFGRIAALREGKPTILRATNRYNDWIGWPAHPVSAYGVKATAKVIASWNDMLCGAAEANGFTCVDLSAAFNGPSGRRSAGDLLAADYIHPSDKGNEVIAETLVELGFAPIVP
jgi:lysophospholipase L1-like esterase